MGVTPSVRSGAVAELMRSSAAVTVNTLRLVPSRASNEGSRSLKLYNHGYTEKALTIREKEKALVEAFSVIVKLSECSFEALVPSPQPADGCRQQNMGVLMLGGRPAARATHARVAVSRWPLYARQLRTGLLSTSVVND